MDTPGRSAAKPVTLLNKFRTGEILPPARTNEQEMELIRKEPAQSYTGGTPA
jgi:hypothetical protein